MASKLPRECVEMILQRVSEIKYSEKIKKLHKKIMEDIILIDGGLLMLNLELFESFEISKKRRNFNKIIQYIQMYIELDDVNMFRSEILLCIDLLEFIKKNKKIKQKDINEFKKWNQFFNKPFFDYDSDSDLDSDFYFD